MSRAGNSTSAGFTLIEVLAVLIIVALALMVVAPRFRAQHGPGIRTAAMGLAEGLRALRGDAIAHARIEPVDLRQLRTRLRFRGSITLADGGGLVFFPDGTSTGGRVILKLGRDTLPLEVDWLTGRVSIAHD